MNSDDRVSVDNLKKLAFERKKRLQSEDDIKDDITPVLYEGMRQKLCKNETLILSIEAQTRKGKSCLALHLMNAINDMIVDLGIKDSILYGISGKSWEERLMKNKIRAIELIGPSRNEFNRVARRSDLKQVCSVIDEDASLDSTGINATTEQAMTDYYFRVCAEQGLHVIGVCGQGGFESPYNKYAQIVIRIVDLEKEQGFTKIKVFYNLAESGGLVFLGYGTIDVRDIIGDGKKQEGKEWYRDGYEQKKTFTYKMYKRGIRGSKDLELALTTLLLYKKLLPYVKVGGYGRGSRNLIHLKLDSTILEMEGCHSILSIEYLIGKADGLLGLADLKMKKEMSLRFAFRAKIPADQLKEYKLDLKDQIEIIKRELHDTINELKKLIRLYIEYMSIGNSSQKWVLENLCKKYKINLYGDDEDE